jgi:hypothetical protein
MLLSQPFKPRADAVKLIDFVQNRCKGHAYTSLDEKPKRGELQMDWLRSEDLKEEKVITAPLVL